ncbi:hypothetical protein [Zavarzinella formosa]|uniref:hypothetical protein n=1 Tax=Zavarzinella formosa TaxID=360055 RepID=UPI0002EDCDA0|nr:hypothetical protein [Zavarzinella formosa]
MNPAGRDETAIQAPLADEQIHWKAKHFCMANAMSILMAAVAWLPGERAKRGDHEH